jgi:Secretion system C-terminal sorting domain
MKDLFSLLIFSITLCECQKLEAQPPFAPLGAKWVYDVYPCEIGAQVDHTFTVTITEDSIIQGKYCTYVPGSFCSQIASCVSDGVYVYQTGSKVFAYEPQYDTFQMVYDFDLLAGSSYRYVRCDEQVGSIDSMTIYVESADDNSQMLRMVADSPGNYEKTVTIYKGIGGNFENRILFGDYCIFLEEPCFYTELHCYYVPGAFDFVWNCGVNFTIEPINTKALPNLFPNPASDFITIQFKNVQQESISFKLLNSMGELVRSETLPKGQNETKVVIENMLNGLYFWQLSNEKELLGNGKLVILK